MTTQTTIAVNAARKAVYDKVEAQLHTFEAQLATLKARAETATADAQLKALANLATAKGMLDRKVAELKTVADAAFERAKVDVEARMAAFRASIEEIESRIKAA